ncbi:MAG: tRNA epoxyqueuosine(34) reductase QueG [Actinomycetota bacterium]
MTSGGSSAADSTPSLADLRAAGTAAGLAVVGATTAEVLEPAATVLAARRSEGLAATMQFTYRNPSRSADPAAALPSARSVVVGAYAYRRTWPSAPSPTSARVARYAWSDIYGELRVGLEAMADVLRASDFRAVVVADSNALVDRNAAWRAGIGWYGKNTNLLVPGHGSWYVLGAVITDAEIPGEADPVADQCGLCRQCLDACPTGAFIRPGVLDARRCIAWLVQAAEPIPIELRAAVGDRLYGCDDCQDVCPPNLIEVRRSTDAAPPADAVPWVDLVELLGLDDASLLERHGRWYIADRDPDVIRRTALVNLGNIGDPSNDAVVATLVRYLDCDRPLLRQHARWAARRLGLAGLVDARPDDDPDVAAEDEHHVPIRPDLEPSA